MATVEKIEEKLLKMINQEDPFAIALTGEWGIGKTHFWKNFYKKNHNEFQMNKYSYVSLFGIDSLESFKYQIAINTHDTNKKTDNFLSMKKLFSYIKDKIHFPKVEIKGFSLSITQTMINSLISNFIEDTVICIDDFERKSDKLDTREIMGIINFLKEEKKCKIIMILHEDKSRDLEVFREYREKVFDDILKIDNNLSIIKSIINNNEVIKVYERFYTSMELKNLRFYIKANKDYKNIIDLNKNLSLTSKIRILENILIIRMVTELEKVELKTEKGERFYVDEDFLLKLDIEKDFNKIMALSSYLNNFTHFYVLDDWGKLILQNLTEYEVNNEILEKLIKEDLISEEKIQEDEEFDQILDEYYSLEIKPNFINRLYDIGIKKARRIKINNIQFLYDLINYKDHTLATKFKSEVKEILNNYLEEHINHDTELRKFLKFNKNKNDVFARFIEEKITKHKNTPNTQNILTEFLRYYEGRGSYLHSEEDINLDLISKEQLKEIIWTEINDKLSRRRFIASIILHPTFSETKREEIRQWTVDILRDRTSDNPDSKVVIEMWLKNTNELKNLEEYWLK
ncbi:P-loop NTPase fold protein [Aggregatibacter kilianii]|mgnify:CR=1 FL=1|jgi:hypothetical protein|uniref:P-loop NTPase fold protein n=1 Tax=Aggregatibacter kilianii TaxID=2025884 RepID=UPI001FB3C369|nr:P-loop NTPase fold protein [Aggregatibacter kilianii]